jgi:ribose transport system permease protein
MIEKNTRFLPAFDAPTRAVLGAIIILLLIGGAFNPQLFHPQYILQQLQTGAFLGIVAAGAMLVILLGHIDLSVPWTMTAAATLCTAAVGTHPEAFTSEVAVLLGLLVGAVIGLVNGVGVAVLRIPSMIWTLAVNTVVLGICVYYSGYYATRSQPTLMLSVLGTGRTFGVPNIVLVWVAVSLLVIWLLRQTPFGRKVYYVGTDEGASYLSGIDTRWVIISAYVFAGLLSALAGMLLAGYAGQSYQRMGDPFLLPSIAAVVLGGCSLFGGRGTYAGTVAGVLLITLISSLLSVAQAPEAAKQIIYGVVIICMVGFYSRKVHA